MRLLTAMAFAALACTGSFGQENPLDELTVTSTRLKCLSGFAEVTYGYIRGAPNVAETTLEFVVIQTDEHNSRFRRIFHLNNKVDDVTPPAYLAWPEDTVDLPNKDQVHVFSEGRYDKADSDVTLAEIRDWIDQPQLQCTIESLLDYRTKSRTTEKEVRGRQIEWSHKAPIKIDWSSNGRASVLSDDSIELQGSRGWQEFTLYFRPGDLVHIDRVLIDVLPFAGLPTGVTQKMMLFEVKPHLKSIERGGVGLKFRSCQLIGNEADESVANCIDFLSDTGWAVADLDGKNAHQLVFELSEPVSMQSDDMFAVTIDSDLNPLSLIRVSFSGRKPNGG